jgi:hypothetical protein
MYSSSTSVFQGVMKWCTRSWRLTLDLASPNPSCMATEIFTLEAAQRPTGLLGLPTEIRAVCPSP